MKKITSWMSFIDKVKELSKMSLTADMYHESMKFYITGKSPEDYVNSLK